MSQDNVALVRSIYDAVASGDSESVLDTYDLPGESGSRLVKPRSQPPA